MTIKVITVKDDKPIFLKVKTGSLQELLEILAETSGWLTDGQRYINIQNIVLIEVIE